ncbi:phage tail protein [Lactiplantibacillus plantarum]|uniref:phage tail protein n=1 Tax=Lactiplantibacillus plantarum TaxID=1590 RepID=UPI001C7341D8|nr:phage tail protein [Lactiplantibacillus plantarum]MBX0340558.1 phage tail protein [Lactiplantibacillus plantarum]MCG0694925.1 phage tail protein [Lactiplantibacillus plantarum]MCG0697972.1 phage tail protein [Lactiplantibacillus plantarum]MCG0700869.1 phage tail protein [Lactiplantibacillus plantarum]MCG0703853.1 phage tail protein [Lactiplantibacillus plantarum]
MAESNATQVILTDDGLKIIKAQSTADSAAGGVTNLNDPNLMSVIEKQNNIGQFAGLTSQYNVLVQNAKDDGIDTTAVTAAYNNLNQFMASVLADPDHASDVDRVTYKKYQDAYNEELANLQNALQSNANSKFTSAASATSQAASTANAAKSAADSAYDYASSEMTVQSNATAKAQSTADSAFSQAVTAINTGQATSQAVTDLKDGSTLTIAELGSGIADKISNSEYASYKYQTASQMAELVTDGAFSAYQQTTKDLISSKVANSDFSSYKDETASAIDSKVASSAFATYKDQTAEAISSKVDNGDFSTYKNQTANDINLKVSTKDLIDQINIQAGNTLISSSGQLTLSGKNIYFDSTNPVIIPSANIDTALVNKKLTAADISANTFSTNNETFTVDSNGAITAKNMTLTGGTLTSPTINASTINGSTINGTTFHGGDVISNSNNTANYYPMTITPDGAYKSTYFDSAVGLQSSVESGAIAYKYRSMIGNGQYLAYDSVINGQGLDLQSGYTSAKDTTFSNPVSTTTGYVIVNANDGITLHGDNQQITFNGTSADATPKGVIITPYGNINPNGTQNIWYVGNNMNMKTASFGMDGSGTYNIQFNRSLDIGNFNINTYHTITSSDNGPIHFNRANGSSVDIFAATVNYTSLVKSSLLSVKKDVKNADTAYWAQLVNSIDLATYQYKSDDNTSHLRLSSIVDDVNDTKQWRLPDIFISRDENGKLNGVDDSVLLNATLATVQEHQKEIDQLNGHLLELEAKLNG